MINITTVPLLSPVASIQAVPGDRLTAAERAAYTVRAAAGEPVYAYLSGGVWFIYDTDTRIPLPTLRDRSVIRRMLWVYGNHWDVRVLQPSGRETWIGLTVAFQMQDHDPIAYQARAQRLICAMIRYHDLHAMPVDRLCYTTI